MNIEINTYLVEVFRWLNNNSYGSNGVVKDVKVKFQVQGTLSDIEQLHSQLLKSLREGEVLGLYRMSVSEETNVSWQSTNGN